MQVIIHLLHRGGQHWYESEETSGSADSFSRENKTAIPTARRFPDPAGVVCGALLLGLFGSGAGAMWSLALGFGAGIGALCGGLGVFVPGLVLVPLDARVGRTFSLGLAALVLLTIEMALGAVVWGIRAL
jgi:hypothetical protein